MKKSLDITAKFKMLICKLIRSLDCRKAKHTLHLSLKKMQNKRFYTWMVDKLMDLLLWHLSYLFQKCNQGNLGGLLLEIMNARMMHLYGGVEMTISSDDRVLNEVKREVEMPTTQEGHQLEGIMRDVVIETAKEIREILGEIITMVDMDLEIMVEAAGDEGDLNQDRPQEGDPLEEVVHLGAAVHPEGGAEVDRLRHREGVEMVEVDLAVEDVQVEGEVVQHRLLVVAMVERGAPHPEAGHQVRDLHDPARDRRDLDLLRIGAREWHLDHHQVHHVRHLHHQDLDLGPDQASDRGQDQHRQNHQNLQHLTDQRMAKKGINLAVAIITQRPDMLAS